MILSLIDSHLTSSNCVGQFFAAQRVAVNADASNVVASCRSEGNFDGCVCIVIIVSAFSNSTIVVDAGGQCIAIDRSGYYNVVACGLTNSDLTVRDCLIQIITSQCRAVNTDASNVVASCRSKDNIDGCICIIFVVSALGDSTTVNAGGQCIAVDRPLGSISCIASHPICNFRSPTSEGIAFLGRSRILRGCRAVCTVFKHLIISAISILIGHGKGLIY